jgi:hypothetical protein
MLSYGGFRTHALGALVTSEFIELWYDRSAIVRSKAFSFKRRPALFVAVMHCLASLGCKRWGHNPLLELPSLQAPLPPGVCPQLFHGVRVAFKNTNVQLADIVFQSHGLIGRGTCVVRAHPVADASTTVILKFSWPAKSRTSEAVILKTVIEFATQNTETWAHNHLPKVLDYEEIEPGQDSPQSFLLGLLKDLYEERVLRIIVQDELTPITELKTAEDVAKAFHGIFKCTWCCWD